MGKRIDEKTIKKIKEHKGSRTSTIAKACGVSSSTVKKYRAMKIYIDGLSAVKAAKETKITFTSKDGTIAREGDKVEVTGRSGDRYRGTIDNEGVVRDKIGGAGLVTFSVTTKVVFIDDGIKTTTKKSFSCNGITVYEGDLVRGEGRASRETYEGVVSNKGQVKRKSKTGSTLSNASLSVEHLDDFKILSHTGIIRKPQKGNKVRVLRKGSTCYRKGEEIFLLKNYDDDYWETNRTGKGMKEKSGHIKEKDFEIITGEVTPLPRGEFILTYNGTDIHVGDRLRITLSQSNIGIGIMEEKNKFVGETEHGTPFKGWTPFNGGEVNAGIKVELLSPSSPERKLLFDKGDHEIYEGDILKHTDNKGKVQILQPNNYFIQGDGWVDTKGFGEFNDGASLIIRNTGKNIYDNKVENLGPLGVRELLWDHDGWKVYKGDVITYNTTSGPLETIDTSDEGSYRFYEEYLEHKSWSILHKGGIGDDGTRGIANDIHNVIVTPPHGTLPAPVYTNQEDEIKALKNDKQALERRVEEVKRGAGELQKQDNKAFEKRLEEMEKEKQKTIDTEVKNHIMEEEKKRKALIKKPKKGKFSGVFIDDTIKQALEISYASKQPCLLMGPPGSGKDTILDKLAEDMKQEVELIPITGDMTKDDFLGQYVLDKANPGAMIWQDGPLARGLKEGKFINISEINMAHQDILALVNNLTQLKNGELGAIYISGKGGEKIVPHKKARIFATANPTEGNLGTKDFNQATLSRFLVLQLSYLGKDDETKLMLTKFPTLQISMVEELIDKVNKIRAFKKQKKIMIDIGTRHIEKVLSLVSCGMELSIAIQFGIIGDCQFDGDRRRIKEGFGFTMDD